MPYVTASSHVSAAYACPAAMGRLTMREPRLLPALLSIPVMAPCKTSALTLPTPREIRISHVGWNAADPSDDRASRHLRPHGGHQGLRQLARSRLGRLSNQSIEILDACLRFQPDHATVVGLVS